MAVYAAAKWYAKVVMLRGGIIAKDSTTDLELFQEPVNMTIVANVCRYVRNVRNRHDCVCRLVYHHRSTYESSRWE